MTDKRGSAINILALVIKLKTELNALTENLGHQPPPIRPLSLGRIRDIGWLQKIRQDAPSHAMGKLTDSSGSVAANTLRIGDKGDYKNLDALVMDTISRVIDEVYQDDTDLVVICGRSLLADKYFPIVNKEQDNSEMLAADVIITLLYGCYAEAFRGWPQRITAGFSYPVLLR